MKQVTLPAPNPRQLGTYIKHHRLRKGWSIRGLAVAAGVDATWLSRLERGDYSTPDPRHLQLLAFVLEIELADLFLLAGYRSGEDLPGFTPYLRAKYDLPPEAIEQLAAHFELVNEKYRAGRKETSR